MTALVRLGREVMRAQRALGIVTIAAFSAIALAGCAGGSATASAAEQANQQVLQSGAFVDVNIAPSIEKNANRIFAWVKVEGEFTAEQLATVVSALGAATTQAGNCEIAIVGAANDAAESPAYLRPAAAELGLTAYLTKRDYRLEMPCSVAQEFAAQR